MNGNRKNGQYQLGALRPRQKGSTPIARPSSTAERLGLHKGALPLRTWKPRKVSVGRDGIFPKNRKCLSSYAPFESSLEATAHLHLSVDHRIKCYACQPHKLQYWMPNTEGGQDKHEYTPDFVALTKDGRLLIIDAKASRFATDEKWTKREPFIRAAYRVEFGADLLVWNEFELRAEPRLSNARKLYRHRFQPTDFSAELSVRNALEEHGTSTIGSLCEEIAGGGTHALPDVFGAIMRLALAGELLLDDHFHYGRETAVCFRGDVA